MCENNIFAEREREREREREKEREREEGRGWLHSVIVLFSYVLV